MVDYRHATLTELIIDARDGEDLDESEEQLVQNVCFVMKHVGAQGIGQTFVTGVGVGDEGDVFIFEDEASFQRWIMDSQVLALAQLFPLEPFESRVLILFREGVFCAPIINRDVLN